METQELFQACNDYHAMSEFLKRYRYEQIIGQVSGLAHIEPSQFEVFPVGNGYVPGTAGQYQYVLKELLKHTVHYDWLFTRLEDAISRKVFTSLIAYRVLPMQVFLERAFDAGPVQPDGLTVLWNKPDGCQGIFMENSVQTWLDEEELAALCHMKKQIRDHLPNIAVCVSHAASDIWEAPRLLDGIRPGYRIYLRHYDASQYGKTVLYALPPENISNKKANTTLQLL